MTGERGAIEYGEGSRAAVPGRPATINGAFMLRIVIHPAEEGGFWAEVPGFPACVSEGDTLEEVRANIHEAFLGMIEAMQSRDTVEEPGTAESIPL
jgi:predicted RNase H-like HicB family nuclease